MDAPTSSANQQRALANQAAREPVPEEPNPVDAASAEVASPGGAAEDVAAQDAAAQAAATQDVASAGRASREVASRDVASKGPDQSPPSEPGEAALRGAAAEPAPSRSAVAERSERHVPEQPPSRGRPRDASRDAALRSAAMDVMAEVGYRALTMDAVAARARAGKATIYRRWESKLDLVIDTCTQLVQRNIPEPDHGAIDRDLHDFLSAFAAFLTGPSGQAAQALVGELPHEPELAAAFRQSFLLPQRDILRTIIERGVDRGEVRADAAVDTVVELAGAALIHRLMLTGEPLDNDFVDRVLNQALLPLLR